ncbi:MAG: alkaline phosphatase family protein [Armatimonadetes bacterium]|nr:alkaline phosphatase family protein [Armatimonadota bacterium]
MTARIFICYLGTLPLFFSGVSAHSTQDVRNKVLVIGIDGLRPDAMRAANTPNLNALIANGAYSDKAQGGRFTVSGPGWSNLLTGVWEQKHGVTDNSFNGRNYGQYPDFFTRLERFRPELQTESLVSWVPINDLIVSRADYEFTHDYEDNGDVRVVEAAADRLRNHDPDAIFVYFADVDVAGHTYGFHPSVSEYVAEIEQVDAQIGEILTALKSRQAYAKENWMILVSSDHGGIGTGHGGGLPEQRTIPFIVSGASAARGAIEPAPNQVDIAVTALTFLGVRIDPKWELDGAPVGLRDIDRARFIRRRDGLLFRIGQLIAGQPQINEMKHGHS